MNKQTKCVSVKRLRRMFGELADMICSSRERVNLSLSGNTFEIHLEDATINITINEATAREGGQL